MKKLMIAVFGLLFFAPVAFASNWGLGLRVGVGENDPQTLDAWYDFYSGNKELDKGQGIYGLEVLYEWDLNNESNKIGAKIGFDLFDKNELKGWGWFASETAEETTYAFPVTVYYKRDNGVHNWSYFAGAGVTFMESKGEASGYISMNKSKAKVFPHVTAGVEYRFSQMFAVGLDLKYNFSAKVERDGLVLSDRSGLSGGLTGRFYF